MGYEKLFSTLNKNIVKFDIDEELDFTLIAITCPLKDYRLCYFINTFTSLDFIRGKEDPYDHDGKLKNKPADELEYHILYDQKTKSPLHFTSYRYLDPLYDTEYYLINNKSIEGPLLIPENPNFDFLIIIKNFIHQDDTQALIEQIKRINDVVLAKEITPKILKSKENLIF